MPLVQFRKAFFYKHCKNDNFFETSYDATTKPSLNFSVVVPKLFKQKKKNEKPPKNVRFSLKDSIVW